MTGGGRFVVWPQVAEAVNFLVAGACAQTRFLCLQQILCLKIMEYSRPWLSATSPSQQNVALIKVLHLYNLIQNGQFFDLY